MKWDLSEFVNFPIEGVKPDILARHGGVTPVHLHPALARALSSDEGAADRDEIRLLAAGWLRGEQIHIGAGGFGRLNLKSGRCIVFADDVRDASNPAGFGFVIAEEGY